MARILVVDDEEPVRLAIRMLLEREGYRVVAAECGYSAVSAIEAFAFDIVIMDILMPGLNGLQTIRIFRENAPDLPIIAMSGYAAGSGSMVPDIFREAIDLGATCYLRKPFKSHELMSAIKLCCAAIADRAMRVA